LAACRSKGSKLSEQKVVFVGAGSAGCGIAEQVISQMVSEGLDDATARGQVFMVDRHGLLTEGMEDLRDFQQALVQTKAAISHWSFSGDYASLRDVMNCAKPDILIGVSGVAGLFTEAVIKAMKKNCALPIIMPLSNPIKQIEARPEKVIEWTEGEVIIATGSPFKPVEYNGKTYPIAQCNNSYIFPGIGLGVLACKARHISDDMLRVASETLAAASPLANTGEGGILPPLTQLSELSKEIAFAVAKMAMAQGHALEMDDERLMRKINSNFWKPEYRLYKRVSS
jgi:malate dehydrogenase (oxaloacetate-decarboxylating)